MCVYSDVLRELGVEKSDRNIITVKKSMKEACRIEKIKIVYNRLRETWGKGIYNPKEWDTLTFEQTASELGVSIRNFRGMVINGYCPDYFTVSEAKKSPKRFRMISVAEFLVGE